MNRVIRHLAYLIRRHDCVVLPGWGALIATRRSARIDVAGGVIVPPSRVLTFNSMITYNDGMLATSVMRREQVSYSAACAMVATGIDEMRRHLSADRRLDMEQVGAFELDGHDNLLFHPDDRGAANAGCVMLAPVRLPLTADERDEREREHAREVRRNDGRNIYLPLSRNLFKVAASMLLCASIGWMAFTSLHVSDEPSRASFVPVTVPEVAVCRQMPVSDVDDVNDDGDAAEESVQPASSLRNVDTDPYCLVVASLASQREVDRYMAMSPDSALLGVSRRGSRYRVYIATGESVAQAMAQRDEDGVAERYPEAWATRR